jgi:thiol-disulfide isomerase/thioredoxin
MTHRLFLLSLLGTFLASGLNSHSRGEDRSKTVAKVDGFRLTDPRTGAMVSLGDFKDRKAIVAVFVGTECPVNNAFMPVLTELHKEYGPKGIAFVAINANRQDTPERVAAHAKKHDLPFPVLKDLDNKVADLFGAKRTPEVFLLDASGKVLYQGRIDDQFGTRAPPSRRGAIWPVPSTRSCPARP